MFHCQRFELLGDGRAHRPILNTHTQTHRVRQKERERERERERRERDGRGPRFKSKVCVRSIANTGALCFSAPRDEILHLHLCLIFSLFKKGSSGASTRVLCAPRLDRTTRSLRVPRVSHHNTQSAVSPSREPTPACCATLTGVGETLVLVANVFLWHPPSSVAG